MAQRPSRALKNISITIATLEKAIRRYSKVIYMMLALEKEPKKIGGMTTFCSEQHLDEFLTNVKLGRPQPFELYQGPPKLLLLRSPVFIFQTGGRHRLRAIARFIGWVEVEGWLKNTKNQEAFCKQLAEKLEKFYSKEGIQPHCRGQKLVEFCSKKDGVRGVFLFDKIDEVVYRSEEDWFRRGDFQKLFGGAQPYAQGFPFRYLTIEETKRLLGELERRAQKLKLQWV